MQGVTVTKIMHFLEEYGNTNYKLLTTPESFFKIKEAMEKLEINMYKDCFMLFENAKSWFRMSISATALSYQSTISFALTVKL